MGYNLTCEDLIYSIKLPSFVISTSNRPQKTRPHSTCRRLAWSILLPWWQEVCKIKSYWHTFICIVEFQGKSRKFVTNCRSKIIRIFMITLFMLYCLYITCNWGGVVLTFLFLFRHCITSNTFSIYTYDIAISNLRKSIKIRRTEQVIFRTLVRWSVHQTTSIIRKYFMWFIY